MAVPACGISSRRTEVRGATNAGIWSMAKMDAVAPPAAAGLSGGFAVPISAARSTVPSASESKPIFSLDWLPQNRLDFDFFICNFSDLGLAKEFELIGLLLRPGSPFGGLS